MFNMILSLVEVEAVEKKGEERTKNHLRYVKYIFFQFKAKRIHIYIIIIIIKILIRYKK